MKKNRKFGLTLIEILVTLPMVAFVFIGMAYMIASSGDSAATEIAKVKTQVAANNILMLIKYEGFDKLADSLKSNVGISNKDLDTGTKDIIKINPITPTSPIHPDSSTSLRATIEKKTADKNTDGFNGGEICVVTVTAPDFHSISTVIKTDSF